MSDLSEIFNRDPCDLTRENIDTIIDHYRKSRAQFAAGIKPEAKPKAPKGPKVSSPIDLGDLGL